MASPKPREPRHLLTAMASLVRDIHSFSDDGSDRSAVLLDTYDMFAEAIAADTGCDKFVMALLRSTIPWCKEPE